MTFLIRIAMAERNNASLSLGIIARKSLFCLFIIASILFIFSWFFVLRSTGRPRFIDHSLLPNSKFPSLIDNRNSALHSQNDFEHENRSVLSENEEGEEDPSSFSQRKEASQANNNGVTCHLNSNKVVLKVFMYDLAPEFHFGLLGWEPQGNSVWPDLQTKVPDYPGGLNLQHSIEYWLTLDLLASELPNPPNARSVIRVQNASEADIIFVPYFSSLSYNRYSKTNPKQKKSNNKVLQEMLLSFLTAQKEWKRSGGRDHLIVAHHPNSMLDARMKLWPATFILADFGRYPPNIANVEKDVIAPYKHVIRTFVNDSAGFDTRPTLLYFQGAIYRKDVCALHLLYISLNFVNFNLSMIALELLFELGIVVSTSFKPAFVAVNSVVNRSLPYIFLFQFSVFNYYHIIERRIIDF